MNQSHPNGTCISGIAEGNPGLVVEEWLVSIVITLSSPLCRLRHIPWSGWRYLPQERLLQYELGGGRDFICQPGIVGNPVSHTNGLALLDMLGLCQLLFIALVNWTLGTFCILIKCDDILCNLVTRDPCLSTMLELRLRWNVVIHMKKERGT